MSFIKSYATDYDLFKKRYIAANLGNAMDAQNAWRYLLGQNKYNKKETLKKLKDAGVLIYDLSTLSALVKASIITVVGEVE